MPLPTWDNLPVDKRERVLTAAAAEFGRCGFSSGSLNTIAREAGIAKGSLFQYFADKLDLYAHVCDVISERVRVEMERRLIELDPTRPFFDFVRDALDAWVDYFQTHPLEQGVTRATNSEMEAAAREVVRSVAHTHYLDALQPLLHTAVERGDIAHDTDLDALTACFLIVLPALAMTPTVGGVAAERLVAVLEAAFATHAGRRP